jgi:hypothetical protein
MDRYVLLIGSACTFCIGIIIIFSNRWAWHIGYRAGIQDRDKVYHEGYKQGIKMGVAAEKVVMKRKGLR